MYGETGATGRVGQSGVTGPPGQIGSTGMRGTTGARGDTGTPGSPGEQGASGSTGPAGAVDNLFGSNGDIERLCAQLSCDEMCEVAVTQTNLAVPYCVCSVGFVRVRVGNAQSCSSLNECLYENGGCDHICTDTDSSYVCSCRPGYQLQANARTCALIESDAVPTSVDCTVLNGGCEFTCVPGSPHHCTCPAGLTLSPSNRTCVDVDECVENGCGCAENFICLNTYGSCQCISVLAGASVGEQRSPRLDSVDELSSSVSDARRHTSSLWSSYYALIAWLGVVTAALLTVMAVTVCRRARRAVSQSTDVLSVSTDSSTSRANIDSVERCVDVTSPHVDDVTSSSRVNSDVTATVGS